MPAIVENQEFPSLLAFKDALRTWAVEQNFTPHILDSDKQRVRAGCRSAPNCQFSIRVNFNAKDGVARVTTCEPDHCHPLGEGVSQNIKRAETARLKFLVPAVQELINVNVNTTTRQIAAAIEQKYSQQISFRQAQKVKRAIVKRPCRHCRVYGHSGKHCPLRSSRAEGANGEAGVEGSDDDDSSGEERPRRKSRCLGCFQTGHNRKNCPEMSRPQLGTNVQDSLRVLPNRTQNAANAPAIPRTNGEKDDFDLPLDDHPSHTGDLPDTTLHSQNPATSQPPLNEPATSTNTLNIRPSVYNSMVAPTSQPGPPSVVTFADNIESYMHPRPNQDRTVSHGQQPQVQRVPQSQPMLDPRLPQPRPSPSHLPTNPKLRAAELMRQAAHHTQEATRLNLEAARLIALAPG